MLSRTAAAVFFVFVGSRLQAQTRESGPLEFGTASGEPGQTVEVPVYATFDLPMIFFHIFFQYDSDRLEFLRISVKGTAAEGINPLGVSWMTYAPGDGLIGIGNSGEPVRDLFHIPPGERQLIARIEFRTLASAPEGSAFVNPVKRVSGPAGNTSLELVIDDQQRTQVFLPSSYIEGGVTILPASGPRPVGDLHCEQFLDRVLISFSLTESYDEILVSRDGSLLAALPGSATGLTDPLPGMGTFTYSVISGKGGKSSIPVSCEIKTHLPAAPSVRDANCGDDGITWINPVAYDGLSVFRNGELIATLPGDAVRYVDPQRPGSLTIYGIAGEIEGFRSPEVICMDHGLWIVEVGDVKVPMSAEKIIVPIYATNPRSVRGIDFCLEIDMDRFLFSGTRQEVLEGTMGYPEPELLAYGPKGACGYPAAGMIWDHNPPNEEEKDLPVGLRQRIFNFVLKPTRTLTEEESFVAALRSSSFMLRPAISQHPDVLIPGEIRIGSAGPKSVDGLSAKAASGGGGVSETSDVLLSWRNGSPYEKVTIERNGVPIAEIPGSSTSYRDLQVAGGAYTYKVAGVDRGKASFPAAVFLSTIAAPGTFLRGDSNRDGRIDIADAINTLDFLFRGGRALPCEDAADADDSGEIDLTDPILMLRYLFLGGVVFRAPGTAYPWFDPTPDLLGCER